MQRRFTDAAFFQSVILKKARGLFYDHTSGTAHAVDLLCYHGT
jgi:hypothetical protein